jgi:hypothetical protein
VTCLGSRNPAPWTDRSPAKALKFNKYEYRFYNLELITANLESRQPQSRTAVKSMYSKPVCDHSAFSIAPHM